MRLKFAMWYKAGGVLAYPASKLKHYVPFLSMIFKELYHLEENFGSAGPKPPDPLQAILL
jgi:hypothetical protein